MSEAKLIISDAYLDVIKYYVKFPSLDAHDKLKVQWQNIRGAVTLERNYLLSYTKHTKGVMPLCGQLTDTRSLKSKLVMLYLR